MTFERLGRVTDPVLGKCIRIACVLNRTRREIIFPIDQSNHAMHPKHPTGYNPDRTEAGSFASSLSFYGELCRYGQFRWIAEGNASA